MLKIVKMTMYIILSIIALLVIAGAIWINVSPEFGGTQTASDIEKHKKSPQYKEGIFQNTLPTSMDLGFTSGFKLLGEFLNGRKDKKPDFEIPSNHVDSLSIVENTSETKLIWFGHSTFLLQIDGKNILLDPMLGDVPAPHPTFGTRRYASELPIEIEKLPQIDAIIISHDHYDHLDYGSIQKLKNKTKQFFVPLGVGTHFRAWGVDNDKIEELDWWQETSLANIKLAFTPSRHFSGRGLSDRAKTLWGSWVIQGTSDNIYFSGDGGYGPHFKEIGKKYGPFDFAMMECGQYHEKWKQIHMMPEETAQAGVDVQTKRMMPIHWGAFTLALHSWTDPIERVIKKANALKLPIITPVIGEYVSLKDSTYTGSNWWINKQK